MHTQYLDHLIMQFTSGTPSVSQATFEFPGDLAFGLLVGYNARMVEGIDLDQVVAQALRETVAWMATEDVPGWLAQMGANCPEGSTSRWRLQDDGTGNSPWQVIAYVRLPKAVPHYEADHRLIIMMDQFQIGMRRALGAL